MSQFIKVRNSEGNFSMGGMYVRFTKKGKTWSTIGYLKRHFAQFTDDELLRIYQGCTLTVMDDETLEKTAIPLFDIISVYITERKQHIEVKKLQDIKTMKKRYKQDIVILQNKIKEIDKTLGNLSKN